MKNQAVSKLLCMMLVAMAWMINPVETNAQETVHDSVDEMPVPPGGIEGLTDYMIKNLKYPKQARKAGIEGKVLVSFVVKSDGTVSAIEVTQGIGGGCDAEAVRMVENSGVWTPGKQGGVAVATQMVLPIQFKL
ncbi:energy transducer TonB [Algoriphagus terrigena]|uniref:energy transducer TonB n=1 Tax=Algoriphagus terrigena TaxID=344884 RepID=UPI00047E83B0|nr:energy transducer TonB [Algoriphagus terrigena]